MSKPKRVKVILPLEMICFCGAPIMWEEGEPASEYEKRLDEFLNKHKHGERAKTTS